MYSIENFSGNFDIEKEELKRKMQRVVSITFSMSLLILFVYLYEEAMTYGETARVFPRIILSFGIFFAAILTFIEGVVKTFYPSIITSDENSSGPYLNRKESNFSAPIRIKRLLILGFWTASFFFLSSVNFVASVAICSSGSMLSFGIRKPKFIIAGPALLTMVVYVVFAVILGIPMGVF